MSQKKNVIIHGVPNVAYTWRCLENRWPNKNGPEELRADLEEHIEKIGARESPHMFW